MKIHFLDVTQINLLDGQDGAILKEKKNLGRPCGKETFEILKNCGLPCNIKKKKYCVYIIICIATRPVSVIVFFCFSARESYS